MSAKNQYTKMISRDGKIVGEIKNLHSRPCPMAGCNIDGKQLYIHRANYTIIEGDMLDNAA